MNENIDLTKILEGCPEGTEFYSSNYGKVFFTGIESFGQLVIIAGLWIFTFTRDDYGSHFTERDLWVVISLILTIILILIYGGIFWW